MPRRTSLACPCLRLNTPDTRFAVKWFTQFGWNEGPSGEADVLARATNTSIDALDRLFISSNGNLAFSFNHAYAARHYAARGRIKAMVNLTRASNGHGLSLSQAWRSLVLGPLAAPLRPHHHWLRDYLPDIGVNPRLAPRRQPLMSRPRFLRWLYDEDSSLPSQSSPAASPVVMVDPFDTSSLLDVAAAISPAQWQRGLWPRGLARSLGKDRVPDEMRLRRRRGGQAWDTWFVIRDRRERHLDALAAIASTPVLADLVDVDQVMRSVEKWEWAPTQAIPMGAGSRAGIDRPPAEFALPPGSGPSARRRCAPGWLGGPS